MSGDLLGLGPFDLIRAVGRGAMGEVWLARHRVQGVEVAVKLLHGSTARDPWALEAFRNEVRAVAGLAHPNVVTVVDHGVLPRESDLAIQGHFLVGTPYLVMEFVRGRPMNRFVGRMSWGQVRGILLQLLDALGHSHARGVVHRDLKPGNVLLRYPGQRVPDPRRLLQNTPLEVKLTDYGLAQAVDRHSAADAVVAGTPAYMAPEQLQGFWRDQGPWTDLYSVGCLAWAMVTGTPPFGRDRPFEEALAAHLHEAPPEFRPVVEVPPGFEAWLRRLLAKRIRQRFPRCADAAWGLAQLSASSDRVRSGSVTPALADDVDDLEPTELPTEVNAAPPPSVVVVAGNDRLDDEPRDRTPLPRTWRRPRTSVDFTDLYGVGLNLYGLRTPPMVGRNEERDALWTALREVYETGEGQAVVIEGPAGVGRSRLGTWLCERADEVGAARVMTAHHDDEDGAASGLVPMVARYLRCTGMERAAIRERLQRQFPQDDRLHAQVDGLAELISPKEARPDDPWARRFRYPRERFRLVRHLIERESAGDSADDWEAVVIVWIDDAHLGSDALDLCRFLLDSQTADPVPVLLMISVQTDALDDPARAREAETLDALLEHPRTRRIHLGPLPDGDHARLVRTLLGMEGGLVEQVAARTAGSPLFAVQLVGDWVGRGLLEPGPSGFTLPSGAEVELPPDLQKVWGDRVDRLLAGMGRKEAGALELAAVLGLEVDHAEWHNACAIARLDPSTRLTGRLLAQRLAVPRGEGAGRGFAFAHSMLREALVRRARRGGRLRRHHRTCATMLERRSDARRGVAERLGRHLLRSGSVVPALDKLLDGARERRRTGEPDAARRLLDHRERALRALQLPTEDELWGLGWVERVEIDLEDSDPRTCEELLTRTEAAASKNGWPRVDARAAVVRGRLLAVSGNHSEARRALTRAAGVARTLDDSMLEARVSLELGQVELRLGHLAAAADAIEAARERFERLGSRYGLATCALHAGRLALVRGTMPVARRELLEALDLFTRVGARAGVGECQNALGELHRAAGDQERAEEYYRAALSELEALRHAEATLPRLNLGLLLVMRGAHVEARRLIEPMLRRPEVRARGVLATAAHLILLAPVASAADWSAWDHHLGQASSLIADTGFIDPDNAMLAELSADVAVTQGEVDRARSAWGLAWQQRQALGDTGGQAEIERKVASLA